ncbi:hypothetical protein AKJ09_08301 [Labilithrix luteola]|uniref:Uncharacterized protein n=1 Tax=Labilithrix luteola TaxID=1391654 RepID=A0A0K1Q7B8_9BACT|nr:hypothetical protein [Labilithrix luteola]AKV01638.1 hypothetical protein AKJ09_08301 [Labilithrix luteola]
MNAYRDDVASLNDRLAALSAEVASMPAITPIHHSLLPAAKYDELESLKARLREAFAAKPTMLTMDSLQHDVAELREFLNRVGAYVDETRSQVWPIPEPESPRWTGRTPIRVFERWGRQLDDCRPFGRGMRSDFERGAIPLSLSVFAEGAGFGIVDPRMHRLLLAGVPKKLGVVRLRRKSLLDDIERYFRPGPIVDPEFDAHFALRGSRALASALLTPIRGALLDGKYSLTSLTVGGGAVSLSWESVLIPETIVLQDWAVRVVTGIAQTVRTA